MAPFIGLKSHSRANKRMPLLIKVNTILNTNNKKQGFPNPPRIPSSGTNLHGPTFRNLAIPKEAVKTEEQKVAMNNLGFKPIVTS